jgi:hypothetical protein
MAEPEKQDKPEPKKDVEPQNTEERPKVLPTGSNIKGGGLPKGDDDDN